MSDIDRFRELLEELAIDPAMRRSHYNLDRYMRHEDGCTRNGDQFCPCGEAPTYCNVDQALDAAEAAFHVLRGMTVKEAYAEVGKRIRASYQSGDVL